MSATPSLEHETADEKTVLGKGVVVRGEILSGEALTIQGEVEGTINMMEHRLTIAENSKVRADVKAREIEVHGSLNGQAEAMDKIFICKGAEFVGDIHSASIVIEDGGYMKGTVDLSRNSSRKPAA